MKKLLFSMILGTIVYLSGCDKNAPIPTAGLVDSVTVCGLLRMVYDDPSVPSATYSIDFAYDNQGRIDTAVMSSTTNRQVTKFYYSVDNKPDSLITTNFAPSPNPGYEQRTYYSYDN